MKYKVNVKAERTYEINAETEEEAMHKAAVLFNCYQQVITTEVVEKEANE